MTKFSVVATSTLLAIALPGIALAEGDPAAGADKFKRQCTVCHVVVDPDGTVISGRKARTGPNLYGVVGATMGSQEDFRYGKSMEEAGEEGYTFTEENFTAYVQDPTGFLSELLDDKRARSKMAFRVKTPEDAADIYAFLAQHGADAE